MKSVLVAILLAGIALAQVPRPAGALVIYLNGGTNE